MEASASHEKTCPSSLGFASGVKCIGAGEYKTRYLRLLPLTLVLAFRDLEWDTTLNVKWASSHHIQR